MLSRIVCLVDFRPQGNVSMFVFNYRSKQVDNYLKQFNLRNCCIIKDMTKCDRMFCIFVSSTHPEFVLFEKNMDKQCRSNAAKLLTILTANVLKSNYVCDYKTWQ